MSLAEELRRLEEDGVDLIEILGQDRKLDSPGELQEIVAKLARAGGNLYAELVYLLTHRRMGDEQAEALWRAAMKNKRRLEALLGRPVAFRVAALDHLTRTSVLRGVRLVSRADFVALLSHVDLDEVTGVYSRRYFNQRVVEEIHRARRYSAPLSLLILDVDDFKRLNDEWGHLHGDVVLRRLGRLIKETTRTSDAVCRFGGDEFAVILPQTASVESLTTAERIREASSAIELSPQGTGGAAVSLSIGGASFPADCEDPEELVALADQKCLEAKRAGKNCVRPDASGHAALDRGA